MICANTLRKYGAATLSALAIAVCVGFSQNSGTETKEHPKAIHQLRIYEIFDGNKKAFHLVGEIEDRALELTDYSPRKELAR
jgi:hypothetical protein